VAYIWTGIMIIKRWTCQCQGILQKHSTNSSKNNQTGRNIWCHSPTRSGSSRLPHAHTAGQKTDSASGRSPALLRPRDRRHDHDCHKQPCFPTSNSNGRHQNKADPAPILLIHPPRRDNPLPHQRHDTQYPLRCWVPKRTRSTKHEAEREDISL
jgi:hypothetical protein